MSECYQGESHQKSPRRRDFLTTRNHPSYYGAFALSEACAASCQAEVISSTVARDMLPAMAGSSVRRCAAAELALAAEEDPPMVRAGLAPATRGDVDGLSAYPFFLPAEFLNPARLNGALLASSRTDSQCCSVDVHDDIGERKKRPTPCAKEKRSREELIVQVVWPSAGSTRR